VAAISLGNRRSRLANFPVAGCLFLDVKRTFLYCELFNDRYGGLRCCLKKLTFTVAGQKRSTDCMQGSFSRGVD
jgi:hypothetical protein